MQAFAVKRIYDVDKELTVYRSFVKPFRGTVTGILKLIFDGKCLKEDVLVLISRTKIF